MTESIIQFLGEDWNRTMEVIRDSLRSDIQLLDSINERILSNPGKQLRPMLSLLASRACRPGLPLSNDCILCAAASEILHNATLLHDDVADKSDLRRGVPTINSLMGPSVGVLVGDFWLVRAMDTVLSLNRDQMVFTRLYSGTLKDLAEGEMLQLQKASNSDTSEDDYLKIVYCKTASLFVAALASAAMSAGARDEVVEAIKEYARCLGTAFQIRDDIFDYTAGAQIGKPVGADILEKKITLPLLGALAAAPSQEAADVRRAIATIDGNKAVRDSILEFVRKYDGLSYAQRRLEEFVSKAVKALDPLENSAEKNYLRSIAAYMAARTK